MYLFHYKDRSILFPDLCSKDCDFWERNLSLNSHVSLFYLLFYSLFYMGKKKKKRVKNLTFLLKFNKDEEEEKREKSSVCAF